MSGIIVETAGCVAYEEGGRLHLAERSTGGRLVGAFVVGLLTLVLGANGVVQLALSLSRGGGSLVLGLVLLGLAALLVPVLVLLVRSYRRARGAGVAALRPLLTIDLARGVLMAGTGQDLCPLGVTRTKRAFQLGSSNRALELQWPGGSVVVARGSPFAGDVGPIEQLLHARGIAAGS